MMHETSCYLQRNILRELLFSADKSKFGYRVSLYILQLLFNISIPHFEFISHPCSI